MFSLIPINLNYAKAQTIQQTYKPVSSEWRIVILGL